MCIASVTNTGMCAIMRDGKLQAVSCDSTKEYACKISGNQLNN